MLCQPQLGLGHCVATCRLTLELKDSDPDPEIDNESHRLVSGPGQGWAPGQGTLPTGARNSKGVLDGMVEFIIRYSFLFHISCCVDNKIRDIIERQTNEKSEETSHRDQQILKVKHQNFL